MYSDCAPDYLKMTALNIPAAVVVCSACCLPTNTVPHHGLQSATVIPIKLVKVLKETWGISRQAVTVLCHVENP